MCCFRFKLWWMTQRMGTSGRDVPLETQFMLLESRPGTGDTTGGGGDGDSGETVYVVMLPLLEGQFRAALQGNDRDELEITLESGKQQRHEHDLAGWLARRFLAISCCPVLHSREDDETDVRV